MKSLHDAVSEIQRTKWTFNNNFDVRLEMESPLASECGLRNLDINLYIKGFEVPQVGVSSFIEHYVLDRHRALCLRQAQSCYGYLGTCCVYF